MCNIRLLCKEMCVQERRASAQYACTFVNAHFTGRVHISHRARAVGLQTRPGRLLQGDEHHRLHSSRASLLWKEQHLPKWLMALTLRRAGRQAGGGAPQLDVTVKMSLSYLLSRAAKLGFVRWRGQKGRRRGGAVTKRKERAAEEEKVGVGGEGGG